VNRSSIERLDAEERVQQITAAIAAGKSQDKVAEELGYSSPRSLDMFMRRRQYHWYPSRNNYFPSKSIKNSTSATSELTNERITAILQLFNEQEDAKEIAKKLNFQGQREMSRYMRSKGYEWSQEDSNYIYKERSQQQFQEIQQEPMIHKEMEQREKQVPSTDIEKFLPMLRTLEVNWDKLMKILDNE
jgi:AraC-like DNA-binding protein